MGFRRAKSTQGNTNCQKNIFEDDQVPGHHPRALSPTTTFTTGYRFVLPSVNIVYYQHILVSFQELLSLRLNDHFTLVVGCINNN